MKSERTNSVSIFLLAAVLAAGLGACVSTPKPSEPVAAAPEPVPEDDVFSH